MMEMLFWLQHDDSPKYQYAYEDITLLGYSSTICPRCSRRVATPQYSNDQPSLVLEGGRIYPDYLQFCGAGKSLFLVSEKALEVLETNKISGYAGYQSVTFESMVSCNNVVHKPNYYNLNITGRIDFDVVAMHIKKKRLCHECGQFEWSRMRLDPIILDMTTWDGADLCLLDSIPGYRLCSQNVKKLIQKYKLTGFSLKACDM